MTTYAEKKVKEEGTAVVGMAFADEDGDAATPTVITWTLTNTEAVVINSREDVSVASPAAALDLVLSGDDLAIGDNGRERVLTVEWEYDSDLGSNLPEKDELRFEIEELQNVP